MRKCLTTKTPKLPFVYNLKVRLYAAPSGAPGPCSQVCQTPKLLSYIIPSFLGFLKSRTLRTGRAGSSQASGKFKARETAKKFNLTGWQTRVQLLYRSCSCAAAEKEKEWNIYWLLLVWNSHFSYYSFGSSWHECWGVVSREAERERMSYEYTTVS